MVREKYEYKDEERRRDVFVLKGLPERRPHTEA
jgi:hypothetical protein